MNITIRNDSVTDIILTEFGYQLVSSNGGTTELTESELQDGIPKIELEGYINSEDIVVLDKFSNDLDWVDGINYIRGQIIDEVLIQEENIKTGGNFQTKSASLTIDATTGWKEETISWPFAISLLSAEYTGHPDFYKDIGEFLIGENTTTGNITQDVAINDIIINVSDSVITNAKIGYCYKLDDGTNTEDLGVCIAIDKVNKTITVENASTQAFLAATPTLVKQTIKMGDNIIFEHEGVHSIGESKIGGSYMPPNTIIKMKYNNISGTAKQFNVRFEYLY